MINRWMRGKSEGIRPWASTTRGRLAIITLVVLAIGLGSGLMVGAWPGSFDRVFHGISLEEATDTVNGNAGRLAGRGRAQLTSTSFRGRAFSFDPRFRDIIIVPDSAELRLGRAQTVSAWIFPTANRPDWVRLVGKGTSAARNYGLWIHPNGGLMFQIAGCNALNFGNAAAFAPLSKWTHVLGTYDGLRIKLYVNGRLLSNNACRVAPPQSDAPLTFGYAGFHTFFAGIIDEIEIHNEAHTARQISIALREHR